MAKKTIEIKCTGSGELSLSQLNDLQGELKERTPEQMKKLRKSILKHGFIAPIFVWENPADAQMMILDGHSRKTVLNELKDEGYSIPQLPIVLIESPSIDDAKEKLLAISSTYGKFTEPGVRGFLESFDFDREDLFSSIDIPFLDFKNDVMAPDKEYVEVEGHLRSKTGEYTEVEMPNLENKEASDMTSVTFIVHKKQLENVNYALKLIKNGGVKSDQNENSNGNALNEMALFYLEHHGQS